MKIYDKKIGRKKVKVFTQKFVQLGEGDKSVSFDYKDFMFKKGGTFFDALNQANRLNSGGKLNCFIITHEMQVGFHKLAQHGQPYHAALLSKEPISLDALRKNFIR